MVSVVVSWRQKRIRRTTFVARRFASTTARLVSRRRRVLRSIGSVAGSSGGVGRGSFTRGGGGIASGSRGVASGGGSVGRGMGGVASGFTRRSGGVLSGFSRRFFLLGAGGERERQRERGKNHFCVHVTYHPDMVVNDDGQIAATDYVASADDSSASRSRLSHASKPVISHVWPVFARVDAMYTQH